MSENELPAPAAAIGPVVLFLDVDGVLNQFGRFQDALIDKVILLRRIVSETGCTIVVSSTWRLYPEMRERLAALLQECGVAIADWTPCLACERGYEIQAWLDQHPQVTRFAILDDHDDMAHLMGFLVRTNGSIGLTMDLAEEAIRRLNAAVSV